MTGPFDFLFIYNVFVGVVIGNIVTDILFNMCDLIKEVFLDGKTNNP